MICSPHVSCRGTCRSCWSPNARWATVTRSANRPSPPRIVRCTAIRVRPARVFRFDQSKLDLQPSDLLAEPSGPLRGPRVRRNRAVSQTSRPTRSAPASSAVRGGRPEPDAGSLNVRSPRGAAHGHPGLERRCVGRRVAIVGPLGPWAHDRGLAHCPDSGVHHTVHRNPSRRPPLPLRAKQLRFGLKKPRFDSRRPTDRAPAGCISGDSRESFIFQTRNATSVSCPVGTMPGSC